MKNATKNNCFDPQCERIKLDEIFSKHDISTEFFSLNGTKCWGRVVDVYDGDTIKIVLPWGEDFFKFSARLYGIDTGELKSHDEQIKKLGLKAKERLIQLTKADSSLGVVWVECLEWDKYGRLLINMYKRPGDKSFGDILIREKLAYAYDGGKKKSDEEITEELKK